MIKTHDINVTLNQGDVMDRPFDKFTDVHNDILFLFHDNSQGL